MAGLLLFACFVVYRVRELSLAKTQPADALLVLGGTPNREKYAAQLMKRTPARLALISSGSEDPCIWLMFEKAQAPKNNVWMEHTSRNTFENFVYAIPLLERWGRRKILLVTDEPQAEHALPMAQIMLGAHGMWVELALTPGSGSMQTDTPPYCYIITSIFWAVASQILEPSCNNLTHLSDVDMNYWYRKGFYCAPQSDVPSHQTIHK